MRYISIEGCMGAGKSTIIKMLQKSDADSDIIGVRSMLQEPVQDWAHLLADFYKNPRNNALILQLEILRSRCQQIIDLENNLGVASNDSILMERSIESSSDVFVPMMQKMNDDSGQAIMAIADADLYNRFRKTMTQIMTERGHVMDGIIFIDTDPMVCLQRIKKRDRTGETSISLEYLKELRKHYMRWIEETLRPSGVHVIVVRDKDEGVDSVYREVIEHLIRLDLLRL